MSDVISFESDSGTIAIIGSDDPAEVDRMLRERAEHFGESPRVASNGSISFTWGRRIEVCDEMLISPCDPWDTGAELIMMWSPEHS